MPFSAFGMTLHPASCRYGMPSLKQESRCKSMTPTLEVSSSCAPIRFAVDTSMESIFASDCTGLEPSRARNQDPMNNLKIRSLSLRSHTWTIMFFSCNVTASLLEYSNPQIDRTDGNLKNTRNNPGNTFLLVSFWGFYLIYNVQYIWWQVYLFMYICILYIYIYVIYKY